MKIQPTFLFAALCLPMARAEFTYVDANLSNTTLDGTPFTLGDVGPPVVDPNYVDGTGTATDSLWGFVSGTSGYEGGSYFTSDNGTSLGDRETTPPLVTSVTLPTPGTYDIVVVFAQNNTRDVAAKIGSAPGTSNNFTSVNDLTVDQTNNPQVDFDTTYANGRGANHGAGWIGKVTTTGVDETVQIYINGLESTVGVSDDERTQYDGIGYQLVTPNPSEYVYVDAQPSNTTLNSDPGNFPDGVPLLDRTIDPTNGNYFNESEGTAGATGDNFWALRTSSGFATFENGDAFESDGGTDSGVDRELTPDLITTITPPTAGIYQIVALFTQGSGRDIAAKIGASPTASDLFAISDALIVNQNVFPLEVDFDGSYTNTRGNNAGAAYLGKVTTTTSNEPVQVFINGLARNATSDDERTQYDGIGFRLVQGLNSTDSIVGEEEPSGPGLDYYVDSSSNVVGTGGPTGGRTDRNQVLGFALPTLPVGATVESVNFSFEISAAGAGSLGTLPDLQVYLLDTVDPDASGITFFYHGPTDPNTSVKLVGSTNIPSYTGTAEVTYDDDIEDRTLVLSGDALALIQSYYGGDNIPDRPEVFFRFNLSADPDTELLGFGRYRIDLAPNESGIEINPPGAGDNFASWISGFSVAGLDGVNDDADGDGIDNGVENFFGTDPSLFSQGLMAGTKSGNAFTFTHPHNATPASDLSASYRWSSDLANWYLGDGIDGPGGGSTVTMTPNTVSGTTTVTATASQPLPRIFLRMDVSQN